MAEKNKKGSQPKASSRRKKKKKVKRGWAAHGLTGKQRRFIEEYCGGANYNASEAARRAGYSEGAAGGIGAENLEKPKIKRAIAAHLDRLSMSAEEAAQRLTNWGRSSMAPFLRLTADGDVVVDLSTKEAQDNLHLIRKLKVTEPRVDANGNEIVSGRIELELHDAKDATVQMAKIRELFSDTQPINVQVPVSVYVPDNQRGGASPNGDGGRPPKDRLALHRGEDE